LHRNGLLKYVIAGKTEGKKEGGRRQKIREFKENKTQYNATVLEGCMDL